MNELRHIAYAGQNPNVQHWSATWHTCKYNSCTTVVSLRISHTAPCYANTLIVECHVQPMSSQLVAF